MAGVTPLTLSKEKRNNALRDGRLSNQGRSRLRQPVSVDASTGEPSGQAMGGPDDRIA